MRILLVEDHEESRKNLQRLIERRGHEVVGVGSAEDAKLALKGENYPFLILDWMLPGQSGIDLCREIRSEPRGDELFILLVTAKADTEDLEQALAAGANDYLTKPLDIALLNVRLSVAERQIRELAERNHARAALQESAISSFLPSKNNTTKETLSVSSVRPCNPLPRPVGLRRVDFRRRETHRIAMYAGLSRGFPERRNELHIAQ
jgi:DNA-binding response OmpR family regulator